MLGFLNASSAGGGWIRINSNDQLKSEYNNKIIVGQGTFNISIGTILDQQENIIENIGSGTITIQSPTNPAVDKLKVNGTICGWCKLSSKQAVYTKYNNDYLEIYGVVASQGSNLENTSYLFGSSGSNLSWTKTGTTNGTYAHEAYYETRSISVANSLITVHNKIQVLWEYNSGAHGWYPYNTGTSSQVYISSTFDATLYKRVYIKAYKSAGDAGYITVGTTKQRPSSTSAGSPTTLTFDVDSLGSGTAIKIGCDAVSNSSPSGSGSDGEIRSQTTESYIYVTEIKATDVV